MMKNIMKNKIVMAVIIGSIVVTSSYIVKAGNYEPGSDKDPIVTKSYVDIQITKAKEYVDSKVIQLKDNNNQSSTNSTTLEVIQVDKGKSIILEGGSEIILRGGKGSIIDSNKGGIADLTQGLDLRQGYEAPANHLLLVPVSDGRGIKAVTSCTFIVKGKYIIN